ncbi:hypothetical protein PF008_g33436 [Phytophthora fragariae]|uniref:Uncharacterized protein n=1 Tax=Phytophthora fragariae TaxID=53985 RepID=A0A6G0PXH2_9STRA|nr:hypothetical protein PF008_g33436 [Phytophthora fragariae]
MAAGPYAAGSGHCFARVPGSCATGKFAASSDRHRVGRSAWIVTAQEGGSWAAGPFAASSDRCTARAQKCRSAFDFQLSSCTCRSAFDFLLSSSACRPQLCQPFLQVETFPRNSHGACEQNDGNKPNDRTYLNYR